MIIAIDFDGTCVTHEYPEVGESIGAEDVLRKLVENGHKLILYTMRSHKENDGRDTLSEAEKWFKDNGIELYGVNENPTQVLWTESPKVYANLYIDDSALGCPKKKLDNGRIVVDWEVIGALFKNANLID
jgi:hydroxymethylpyrimidine pyrophosphatase-like HAD family hydrolase